MAAFDVDSCERRHGSFSKSQFLHVVAAEEGQLRIARPSRNCEIDSSTVLSTSGQTSRTLVVDGTVDYGARQ
jgi:hypothetical protein